MKTLFSLALLLAFACDNRDAARIYQLEMAIMQLRTQFAQTGEFAQEQPWTTVTVDHRQSWRDAGEGFDHVHPYITDESFPPESSGTQQVVLKPLNLYRAGELQLSTDEVLDRLDAQGMRPATARELIAFAKANHGRRWQISIVALGSTWNHSIVSMRQNFVSRNVVSLVGFAEYGIMNWNSKGRRLGLGSDSGWWPSPHWFLAVRK